MFIEKIGMLHKEWLYEFEELFLKDLTNEQGENNKKYNVLVGTI